MRRARNQACDNERPDPKNGRARICPAWLVMKLRFLLVAKVSLTVSGLGGAPKEATLGGAGFGPANCQ